MTTEIQSEPLNNWGYEVEIAPWVILKCRYPKPKSREEAVERLRKCLQDPEKVKPLFEAFFGIAWEEKDSNH